MRLVIGIQQAVNHEMVVDGILKALNQGSNVTDRGGFKQALDRATACGYLARDVQDVDGARRPVNRSSAECAIIVDRQGRVIALLNPERGHFPQGVQLHDGGERSHGRSAGVFLAYLLRPAEGECREFVEAAFQYQVFRLDFDMNRGIGHILIALATVRGDHAGRDNVEQLDLFGEFLGLIQFAYLFRYQLLPEFLYRLPYRPLILPEECVDKALRTLLNRELTDVPCLELEVRIRSLFDVNGGHEGKEVCHGFVYRHSQTGFRVVHSHLQYFGDFLEPVLDFLVVL